MKTKNVAKSLALPFLVWLAIKIARTMLLIKATTYRKEAYKWASGMLMHIYNDNRMMLGNYWHRIRIAKGFIEKFKQYNVAPDYILGTSMSGIAPATSVAQMMDKKLLINQNGNFYLYETDLMEKYHLKMIANGKVDAIVSIDAMMIPHGVQYANKLKVGFAYMRPSSKNHGKEQQIEGNLKSESRIAIVCNKSSSEEKEFKYLLKKAGYIVAFVINPNTKFITKITDLKALYNKKIPVIEDLFSTGGSSAEEVYKLRNAGAICNYCFSIFSYGFKVLKKQFLGEAEIGKTGLKLKTPCLTDSLLSFPVLFEQIEKLNLWTEKTRISIKGEIYNFDGNYRGFLQGIKGT